MIEIDDKALINDLANEASDGIDLKGLIAFYYDNQVEYLESLGVDELLEYAAEHSNLFTKEDYIISANEKMTNKYKVGFHYSENGYTEVEAVNQKEAEVEVEKALENNGTVGMEVNMIGRECVITDSYEAGGKK